ncbi:MAG: AAA family ATPase, partial [Cyanobacteria bacterium J06627_28]
MVASPTIMNPFPGLRPFDLDEEHLFFGREGQADELLDRLNQTGFLAVVGSSGSGKSSLVRAGLLPSLYSGFLNEASSHWRVALMRPGNAPIRNLAEALNATDVFGQEQDDDDRDLYTELTETTLRRGDLGLVEVVKQARMAVRESLLLVIDQFEELFRFKRMADTVAADDEAAAFVKLFLTAVQQEAVPIYVVLTMRSDFLGDCAQFRGLPEAINDSQYLIPRMTRDQRRSAVEGPVAVGEATITPRLVNRVLNDMGDDPDQLPILQHAMMRTWRQWSREHALGEPLDLRHYEAVGGMTGALSQHADEIYQSLDTRSQAVAEKLFKCLTEKGPDNREIRRPTSLAEVCAVAGATPEEVIRVVDVFRAAGRSFLIPPEGVELDSDSVLDISHESFMRVWKRLKDWVDDEARSAQIYRRLADTAVLHEAGQAGYLQDPELTVGLTWRQVVEPNQVWAERYSPEFEETMAFLDASAGEKELVRRRKNRVLYSFIGSLIMLSGVAMGAAGLAYVQLGIANEQTKLAEEQTKLANERGDELENQGKDLKDAFDKAESARQEADDKRAEAEKAKQEAEEANTEAQKRKQEAEQAQDVATEQRQVAETALVRAEEGEAEAGRQADIAREQTRVAKDNELQARSATERAEVQALNSNIQAKALTVENLMASNLNFKAMITALELAQEIQQRESGRFTEQVIALGKNRNKAQGKIASTYYRDSSISPGSRLQAVSVLREVYYLPGYLEKNTLAGHFNSVYGVSFSPDGQTVASASQDGTVKLWDRHTGKELKTLKGHSNYVIDVRFSSDGQTLATASSSDTTVKLWDLRSGEELKSLDGHSDGVKSISFSPDGQTLATASRDTTVKLWDFRSGEELKSLDGHSDAVEKVIFSPDGQTLATASRD